MSLPTGQAGGSREQIKKDVLRLCASLLDVAIPQDTAWPEVRLSTLENQAWQVGQTLAGRLLEKIVAQHPQAQANAVVLCPHCAKPLRIQEREQIRPLPTTLGPITYRRPYGTCDRCRISGAPLDWALGIPSTGASVSYRQQVADACTIGRSFEIGKKILHTHDRLTLGTKAAWRISLQEGRRLVKERQADVQTALTPSAPVAARPAQAPLPLLVVTCDGGRVQTIASEKDKRWKEDRIGAVYDAIPKPHPHATRETYDGAKAITTTFVASMECWDAFGPILYSEALKRGYARARQKVFLSDGAESIRTLRELQFPEAIPILDWCHAAEHLHACAAAAFGAQTPKAFRWALRQIQYLWDGKIPLIITELQKQSKRLGAPRPDDNDLSPRLTLHRNAFSYFPNNQKSMDYPFFRSKGWPIGSGVAEAAVKRFGLRVKGSEKFWRVEGAEEMLALCASLFSEDGRWQRYWDQRACAYVPPKPPPRITSPPAPP
jgi:hypothetical protein